MQRSFLQKCGLSSFHSNIKPAFNHRVCLSKHQIPTQYAVGVIDIQYCCQKVQWSMHIAAFLETRKITVERKCCLQVAICLIFPSIGKNILARTL